MAEQERDLDKQAEDIVRPFLDTPAIFGVTPSNRFRNESGDAFQLVGRIAQVLKRMSELEALCREAWEVLDVDGNPDFDLMDKLKAAGHG